MTDDMPPIREQPFSLQIDQKKGKWPFANFVWAVEEATGKKRLLVSVDCNEAGDIIGENKHRAAVALSKKKVEALRDFLDRTLDEL